MIPKRKALKKLEAKQLSQIKELDLHRVVEHLDKGDDGRKTTIVCLYDWQSWIDARKPDTKVGAICLASGHASCSKKDNFNKRLGRIIATGRAIKQFINSELYKSKHARLQYITISSKGPQ
jgi:hypothetical protein